MKESEIDKKIADQDRGTKLYVDMKIRALKKVLAPFIWAGKHPGKAILILFILFMISAFVFHMIDIKGTIEKRFNIELKDGTTVT